MFCEKYLEEVEVLKEEFLYKCCVMVYVMDGYMVVCVMLLLLEKRVLVLIDFFFEV